MISLKDTWAASLAHGALFAGALAVAWALGGCAKDSKSGVEGAPASPAAIAPDAGSAAARALEGADGGGAAASAPAGARPKSLAARLRCDKLLPESALLGFMAAYKVTQEPEERVACPACGPACDLVSPSKPFDGVQVAYTCNVAFDPKVVMEVVTPLKNELQKSQKVTGFGRGGIHGEKDNGTFYEVVAFDDDTDCRVKVDWMRGKKQDALHLAQAALAGISPSDLR